MIETVEIIEPWLFATLSGDVTLAGLVGGRISGTLSATPLATPYVTFLCQSPRDVIGVGGTRVSTDNLYMVKGVAQTGSWNVLLPIAQRIDTLINLTGRAVSYGGGSLTCTREMTHELAEVDEGLQYRHLGGIYRIRASADS